MKWNANEVEILLKEERNFPHNLKKEVCEECGKFREIFIFFFFQIQLSKVSSSQRHYDDRSTSSNFTNSSLNFIFLSEMFYFSLYTSVSKTAYFSDRTFDHPLYLWSPMQVNEDQFIRIKAKNSINRAVNRFRISYYLKSFELRQTKVCIMKGTLNTSPLCFLLQHSPTFDFLCNGAYHLIVFIFDFQFLKHFLYFFFSIIAHHLWFHITV